MCHRISKECVSLCVCCLRPSGWEIVYMCVCPCGWICDAISKVGGVEDRGVVWWMDKYVRLPSDFIYPLQIADFFLGGGGVPLRPSFLCFIFVCVYHVCIDMYFIATRLITWSSRRRTKNVPAG